MVPVEDMEEAEEESPSSSSKRGASGGREWSFVFAKVRERSDILELRGGTRHLSAGSLISRGLHCLFV